MNQSESVDDLATVGKRGKSYADIPANSDCFNLVLNSVAY